MAEFPALTLWTDAYLADTRHLTTVQHGAYLLLLITAWRSPGYALPDDDRQLRLAAGNPRSWPQIKPAVMAFWDLGEDHKWRQKRLSLEANRALNQRHNASLAGKASARKRYNSSPTTVDFPLNGTLTEIQLPLPSSHVPSLPPNPHEDVGGQDASQNGRGERPSRVNGTNPRALEAKIMDAVEQAKADARAAKWRDRLLEYAGTGHWPSAWGPKPSMSKAVQEAGVFLPTVLHDEFRAIEAKRRGAP